MSPHSIGPNAPPVLGPESAGMLMTPEEFDEVSECDDGYHYELIRGVLVVTPIPSEAEASPNSLGHPEPRAAGPLTEQVWWHCCIGCEGSASGTLAR